MVALAALNRSEAVCVVTLGHIASSLTPRHEVLCGLEVTRLTLGKDVWVEGNSHADAASLWIVV